ncbi:MAG: PQQ-binding-like beta-propeller repeat protein, partial [Planctomycetales bacterium]|nr:PQQ-binding-like beta-propeller repeat protein [Planctomycetales bacterium]
FVASLSFNRGKPLLIAVRPGGTGDVSESHVSWSLHRGIPEVPTPVLIDDRIYMVADGGLLTCVNAGSGEIIYRQRLGTTGHYRASPVATATSLYVVSEAGVLSVIQLGDKFKLISQSELGDRVDATPALDRNTIYIRTEGHLHAFRSRVSSP